MSSSNPNQPKPATRSSKRNKRPSSPVLQFLSNARKKRGGGGVSNRENNKDTVKSTKAPLTVSNTAASENATQLEIKPVSTLAPVSVGVPVTTSSITEVAKSHDTSAFTSHPDMAPLDLSTTSCEAQPKGTFPFKSSHFTHLSRSHSSRKVKNWKSLKQILTTERTVYQNSGHVTYGTIDTPPSFKPAKKYSDLSGFEAKYTDPQTKLRYSNPQEFAQLRILPSDTVAGLLSLRRANLEVQ